MNRPVFSRIALLALLALLLGAAPAVAFSQAGAPVQIREWQVPWPDTRPRDPAVAPDGRIWFTMQRGNAIGRIDMVSGAIRVIPVPSRGALPYGILADDDGRAWAVLLGSNRLATVTPETHELAEIELPRAQARLRRVGLTDDGRVWYGDFTQGYIGAYDPADGVFEEWKTPSDRSGPYAMTTDDRGRVWFVETGPQPNLLQGFDPASGKFLPATAIPSDGRSVRHMVFDPNTRSLWFGTDTNRLARARVPD